MSSDRGSSADREARECVLADSIIASMKLQKFPDELMSLLTYVLFHCGLPTSKVAGNVEEIDAMQKDMIMLKGGPAFRLGITTQTDDGLEMVGLVKARPYICEATTLLFEEGARGLMKVIRKLLNPRTDLTVPRWGSETAYLPKWNIDTNTLMRGGVTVAGWPMVVDLSSCKCGLAGEQGDEPIFRMEEGTVSKTVFLRALFLARRRHDDVAMLDVVAGIYTGKAMSCELPVTHRCDECDTVVRVPPTPRAFKQIKGFVALPRFALDATGE